MLKNMVQVLQKINDRDLSFLCANDTPTSDIKEFAYHLIKLVGNIEDHAKAQQEQDRLEKEIVDEGKELEKAEEGIAEATPE